MINERIVNCLAARYSKRGIVFEDLQAEARLHAVKALKKYDSSRGTSRDTLQWTYIERGLKDFCQNEWDWQDHKFNSNVATAEAGRIPGFLKCNEIDDKGRDFIDAYEDSKQSVSGFEIMTSLSIEAQTICRAIFETPTEYLGLVPRVARGKIAKQLRGSGWSWSVIWATFNEIKAILQ